MPNLSLPVFASYMRHQAPGSYDIGFIDRKKYTGELTYTPVNNTLGFWDVKVLGYQIGNGSAIDAPFDAIVGKSLFSFPYNKCLGLRILTYPTLFVHRHWNYICSSST